MSPKGGGRNVLLSIRQDEGEKKGRSVNPVSAADPTDGPAPLKKELSFSYEEKYLSATPQEAEAASSSQSIPAASPYPKGGPPANALKPGAAAGNGDALFEMDQEHGFRLAKWVHLAKYTDTPRPNYPIPEGYSLRLITAVFETQRHEWKHFPTTPEDADNPRPDAWEQQFDQWYDALIEDHWGKTSPKKRGRSKKVIDPPGYGFKKLMRRAAVVGFCKYLGFNPLSQDQLAARESFIDEHRDAIYQRSQKALKALFDKYPDFKKVAKDGLGSDFWDDPEGKKNWTNYDLDNIQSYIADEYNGFGGRPPWWEPYCSLCEDFERDWDDMLAQAKTFVANLPTGKHE